jgi:hypothetical protein
MLDRHFPNKSMKKMKAIASAYLAGISLLFSGTSEAKELPLNTWKSIMNTAKIEYNKGNIIGACTNATNLAHFMNTKIYEVRGNKTLQKDVTFLMWDWQTYVGKYCGGRPLKNKSRLWKEIDNQ